mmetsp:Transcript_124374/g.265028  ORF Transcript_124374/g.265028 Transcript_124374/m.265028 type:complete len:234 (+) Transcript_124374:113-814(+)
MYLRGEGCAQRRRGAELAAATRILVAHLAPASWAAARLLCQRPGWPGCAGAVASLVAAQCSDQHPRWVPVAWHGMEQEQQPKQAFSHDLVEHRGKAYDITFERYGGPRNMGRLLLVPHGPAPTPQDVAECLDHLYRLVEERVIDKDFVAVMDISQMMWPSVLRAPEFFSIIRDRSPPSCLRDRTQAFAVVRAESMLFKSVSDALLLLVRPETAPIFAGSRSEAENGFRERLES